LNYFNFYGIFIKIVQMKKCKCCNVEDAIKYSKYSNGEFCSSKCARSYSTKEKRNEINKKVSRKLSNHKKREYNYSGTKIIEMIEKRKKYWDERNKNADFNTLGIDGRRKRVILEQDGKCNKCGLSTWLGEKIPMELEHIDGNHSNNVRNNLEALCPNCHSLTPTWRGRNKQNQKHKVSDEMLIKSLIHNNFNMRQSLLEVGLAAKGGNYVRCHRLKNEYDEII
jgi:tRNA G10  N-methylase Trm11